jgi:uncharacterized protein YdcH (DUF465 family)
MISTGLDHRQEGPMEQSPLTARLIHENEEFRSLHRQHTELESRLHRYREKEYMDAAEELEARLIKKRKLALKDRMAAIAESYSRSPGHRTGAERGAGS